MEKQTYLNNFRLFLDRHFSKVDLFVVLIAFSAILLIFKTGTNGLINVGDSLFPFFPKETASRLFYTWDSHNLLGQDKTSLLSQITWYGLVGLSDQVGVPLWLINRFWFALPFFLFGLSMWFLSGVIFKKDYIARVVSTTFFIYNPFTLSNAGGSNILLITYAIGVMFFAVFIRSLNIKHSSLLSWLLLAIFSIFLMSHLVVLIMTYTLCTFYWLYLIAVHRKSRDSVIFYLKYFLGIILVTFIVNAWFLVPFFSQFLHPSYFQSLFGSGTDSSTLGFLSERASLFDVSRLFYGYTPSANYPLSIYYYYLLSPTIMSILVLLVFATSFSRKKSLNEYFFLSIAFFSVILATGNRPPFGFVFQFLWDHFNYFHIFRTATRFSFYTAVSYSILLGYLYLHLKDLKFFQRDSFFRKALPAFLIASSLASSWPLLSGDILGGLKPNTVPPAYQNLRDYLLDQPGDYRVMVFPFTSWLVSYSWNAPFDMQDVIIDYIPKDMIANTPGYLQDLPDREITEEDPLYASVYKNISSATSQEVLKEMGVRYLVVHRDLVIVHGNYYPVDIEPTERAIRSLDGVKFVQSFGDLDLYELDNYQPRIYVQNTTTKVNYERVNPTEYKVSVHGADQSYKLILSENYSPGWKISGNFASQTPLDRNFGNVWTIDEAGDHDLTLRYEPQGNVFFGFLISIFGSLGLTIFLLIKKLLKYKRSS